MATQARTDDVPTRHHVNLSSSEEGDVKERDEAWEDIDDGDSNDIARKIPACMDQAS